MVNGHRAAHVATIGALLYKMSSILYNVNDEEHQLLYYMCTCDGEGMLIVV